METDYSCVNQLIANQNKSSRIYLDYAQRRAYISAEIYL